MRPARPAQSDAGDASLFALAVVGLATILYLGYASFFVLKTGCVLCLTTYACVLGISVVSLRSTSVGVRRLPAGLARDIRTLVARPAALLLVALFLGSVGWAMLAFPRSARSTGTTAPPVFAAGAAVETKGSSSADPQQAFEGAWASQPRVDLGIPPGEAKVVIVKFLDWECPTCKLTDEWYGPMIARLQETMPGALKYVEKDFPLDPKCNFAFGVALHPAPCEAAAAVRLATERGQRQAMVDWIFANQSAGGAAIAGEARRLLQIGDFTTEYARVLPAIRQDISDGAALKITGTPTIFINGVQCPPRPLSTAYFQMAIEYRAPARKGQHSRRRQRRVVAMSIPACPVCASVEVTPIESINRFAEAVYFRCRDCGHVWTRAKGGDPPLQRDVTLRPPGKMPQRS